MILVVFGLPGAGKTHFSRHLAKEIEADHFNTDQVRKELGLEGKYDPESKQRVYDHLLKLVEEHTGNGSDVILDGTFHTSAVRNEFKEKARQLDQPIAFIEMKASDQTIEKRMKAEREFSEADYKVYLQLKYDFEEMEDPHLVLVSEVHPLDEMIRNANCYIDENRTDSDAD